MRPYDRFEIGDIIEFKYRNYPERGYIIFKVMDKKTNPYVMYKLKQLANKSNIHINFENGWQSFNFKYHICEKKKRDEITVDLL